MRAGKYEQKKVLKRENYTFHRQRTGLRQHSLDLSETNSRSWERSKSYEGPYRQSVARGQTSGNFYVAMHLVFDSNGRRTA